MKPIIWPYKMTSQSARLLARELGVRRVYPDRHYRPRRSHLIINWGNSTYPNWDIYTDRILNHPKAVRKASNKLSTLRSLHDAGVGIPLFTTDKEEAREWAEDYNVYCRLLLTAKGGQGIIVADHPDMVHDAPLYTQGVDVKREFRVHVFDDKVIDFTEKKKRRETIHNLLIRNYNNGWVFCREGVELPDNVRQGAVDGVVALGLDFGAVDICLDSNGDYYIFEINTAPGLQGSSILAYKEAINGCLCI